ncbi:tape measure protein [Hansschlegelia sp.]|uniref:tape measure protein n=1 Tax=Hansschlegelia sp. TaxID=2041892 RepID=UPI002C45C30A|nr:tape measure protein [Hansschlegelia sp.]HVI28100.1 tape measure protein [Hansschlegelia sp.]
MADTPRILVASLEARTAALEKGLNRANDKLNRSWSQIEGRTSNARRRIESETATLAQKANQNLARIGVGLKPITLGVALGGFSAAALASEGAKLADDWTKAKNSLRVAGLEGESLQRVLDSLFDAAQANSAPISALTDLYGKAAQASGELGASSKDLIRFSSGVATALKAAGTSSSAASGALTQLGQLLGSSRVQAEEFNSVNEGARPILQAVAAGIDAAGGSVSKLKALVAAGAISNKDFFDGFLKGLPVVEKMAASALPTLEGSATRVTNALTRYVGQSDESLDATARLKAGLNALADNFDATADMALKVAGVIAAALVGRSIAGMIVALGNAGVAIRTTIAALTALRGAATAAGFASAFASLGAAAGPIGAILGAAAAAALYFATRGDGAAEAALRASDNMKALGVSADSTADQIKRVADELAKLTGAEIKVKIADTSALITSKYRQLRNLALPQTAQVGRGKVLNPALDEYRKLTDAFTSGKVDLAAYRDGLDKLAERFPKATDAFAKAQEAAAEYTAALKTRAAQDQALAGALDKQRGPSALDQGLAAAAGVPDPSKFGPAALAEASKPEDEKRIDKQTSDLVAAYENAGGKITDAVRESFRDIARQIIAAQDGAKAAEKSFSASAAGNAFNMIAKFEAFRSSAYWDKNHFRVGYGSDTTTGADGKVSSVAKETVVTMADAVRDLKRRIGEFQAGIVEKIGADRWAQLSEQQQAALTSISYNYGNLPERIAAVIRSGGTTADIEKAIRGLAGDNGGINRNRRNDEADAFAGGATYQSKQRDTAADFDRNLARDGQRRVEDLDAETAALQRQAEANGTLAASLEQFDAKAEHARIVHEELRKLADAEIEATPERKAAIEALADAEVAAAQRKIQAQRGVDKAKEKAAEHERAAQELYATSRDAFKGLATDLLQGASAGEAFRNALSKIADKLLDMVLDQLWTRAFGGVGNAGGGIFGGIASLLGFADGGYTGPGGVHEPAGVVHKGEVVWSQDDVARAGGVAAVEGMRLGRRGYARGGVVGLLPGVLPPLAAPALPSAGAALGGTPNQTIAIANEITVTGSAGTPEQNDDLAKRMAKEVEASMRGVAVAEMQKQLRPGGLLDAAARRR